MRSQGVGKLTSRAVWAAVVFLALIGIAIVARRIIHLVPILAHGYRPPPTPAIAQFAATDDLFARHPYLTLVHIVPAILFVTLGPLQFSRTLRARHPQFHRVSGRIYIVSALIIGVSALIMSFAMPAIGGFPQALATAIFGAYFLVALSKAFLYIRRREIPQHREWMIRVLAIGIAVATIRPIVGLFVGITIATRGPAALNLHNIFAMAFWLGFTLHFIAAECWIQATSRSDMIEQNR